MPEQSYINGVTVVSIIDNLKKKIISSIVFGTLVVLVLVIYADIDAIRSAFYQFEWKYVPIIIALTVLNYLLRFYKWDYYLSQLGIHVDKKDSAIVFFSGLTMSVTPGKLGEVLKSYLLKQMDGISISRTAPIVFAERLTDVVGLIILSSFGAVVFQHGEFVLASILFVVFSIVAAIQSRSISLYLIAFCEKLPVISKFAHHLHELYESAFLLLKMRTLGVAIVISVVSWFFECVAMWYVLKGFGLDMSILSATFVFAFSSMAGAVSMLPGGLGVAEGSIVGILYTMGIPKASAVGSALIIRFFTLWFGVLVGALTLGISHKKFKLNNDKFEGE